MSLVTVQLNHPGREKAFPDNTAFSNINNKIVRHWNSDKEHYRKFLNTPGRFIKSIGGPVQSDTLFFWGEWEGYSIFHPFENLKEPIGLHTPFFCLDRMDDNKQYQNTDPYVYGDRFKYAICSQNGIMLRLDEGSLILFGSKKKEGFVLDTVFVVKTNIDSKEVQTSGDTLFSHIYDNATLCRLKDVYKTERRNKHKVYLGQMHTDDPNYFSYVPCATSTNLKKQKAVLRFHWIAKQQQGHPYSHLNNRAPIDIWNEVTTYLLDQGFYLATSMDEPAIYTSLEAIQ
ncbi:MAG: hypothetical protein FJX92_05145 [Bacteroidetes bacterium]|nr:hypothetical protein [Bacteroidota bacterium]